jgi:membrane-associated phospholipid phosphatase
MTVTKNIQRLDEKAVALLPAIRRRWLTPILVIITYSGSSIVWFGLTSLFMVLFKLHVNFVSGPIVLLAAMLGSFFSLISGQVLKKLFGRRRPWMVVAGHRTLVKRPRDSSMPSTHASTAFALAVGLTLSGHPLAPYAWPWAFAVVFSRYYLGVHFPSDLAVGALWGMMFGAFNYEGIVRRVLGVA